MASPPETTGTSAGTPESSNPPISSLGPLAQKVLPRIFRLYDLTATAPDYEVYAPTARFDDPLMSAHGVKQIKSAFYSMQVLFQEAGVKEYTVQETAEGKDSGEILVDNRQHYKVLGRCIDVISLIRLKVENGYVVHHEDLWNKKPLWSTPTRGPLGYVGYGWRRGSMMLTHLLMGFGKDIKGTS